MANDKSQIQAGDRGHPFRTCRFIPIRHRLDDACPPASGMSVSGMDLKVAQHQDRQGVAGVLRASLCMTGIPPEQGPWQGSRSNTGAHR